MGDFKNLQVWQQSLHLASEVYRKIQEPDIKKDFALIDQIRRSAISIPSNIAEGEELGTNKQSIRHFHIAKGSSAELYTQLLLAKEIGYLSGSEIDPILDELRIISASLYKLIKYRTGKKKIE